jgi:hypothetical protein
MLLPGVFRVGSANTVQSEKLIVRLSVGSQGTDRALGFVRPEGINQLAERLSGETFSQRVSVGQWPKAHPAIRVGADRLAQYNDSVLLSWKTSAPNLKHGGVLSPPRVATGRAPFSESRFMRVWILLVAEQLV